MQGSVVEKQNAVGSDQAGVRRQRKSVAISQRKVLWILLAAIPLAVLGGGAIGWAIKERFTFSTAPEEAAEETSLIDDQNIREERLAERDGEKVIINAMSVLDQFFSADTETELKKVLLSHGDGYPLIDSLIALHDDGAILGKASDLMVFHTGWANIGDETVEEIQFGGPLATKEGLRIIKVYLYKIGESWKVDGYVYEQSMTGRLQLFFQSDEIGQQQMLTVELRSMPDQPGWLQATPPGNNQVLFSFDARAMFVQFPEIQGIEQSDEALINLRVRRAADGSIEMADDPIVGKILFRSLGGGL